MNNEKRTKVFNDHAQKVVAAVCGAIAEAMKKGEGLESVIFFGKFSEMRATPKVIYKVECRGDEIVDRVFGDIVACDNHSADSNCLGLS